MPDDNKPTDRSTARTERVRDLLRAAAVDERAPHRLRERIGGLSGGGAAVPRRRRPLLGAWGLGAAAIVALAAFVAVTGAGPGVPSLAQAATLGQQRPDAPAPGPAPGSPYWLSARVGNLSFPNWGAYGGWRSDGERRGQLGDRSALTVYYAAGARQIAYTIVAAPALAAAGAARGGHHITLWQHGRATVVWDEDGHTCLLSGAGVSPRRLWRLASEALRR